MRGFVDLHEMHYGVIANVCSAFGFSFDQVIFGRLTLFLRKSQEVGGFSIFKPEFSWRYSLSRMLKPFRSFGVQWRDDQWFSEVFLRKDIIIRIALNSNKRAAANDKRELYWNGLPFVRNQGKSAHSQYGNHGYAACYEYFVAKVDDGINEISIDR